MSDKKIKILIIALVLMAGFSIFKISIVLSKYLQPAKATAPKEKLEEALGADVDKDGIPDTKEAYYRTDPLDPDTDGDGFLDGEEIVSGCDPTIKSPEDCRGPYSRFSFEDKEKNFTDEMASIIVSGLYSGDLKPKSKNFNKSISTLGSFFTDVDIYPSDSPKIKSNNSPTPQETKEYISSFNYVLQTKFLEPISKNPLTPEKIATFYEATENNETAKYYSENFKNLSLELGQLEVPADFSEFHKNFLEVLTAYELAYGALINSQSDPLKSLMALGEMPELSESFKEPTPKTLGIFNPGFSKLTGAVPSVDILLNPSFYTKEYGADLLARSLARSLLSQLTNRMISKIQKGGREGGPAFVQDWRSFILGGQYRGEDVFRGILYESIYQAAGGQGIICPQFKEDLGKIFNAAPVNLRGINKRVCLLYTSPSPRD